MEAKVQGLVVEVGRPKHEVFSCHNIQQMHPTKALSSDGMSPIFYKKYWDIVGLDVVQFALDALNSGVLPCRLNETYICLIPKVKSPQKITEFKPISYIKLSLKFLPTS